MLLRAGPALAGAAARLLQHLAEVAHVLDRDDDLDLERLADAGVDDRDRAGPPGRLVAAEEAGDLLERALRGRQPDALRWPLAQRLEPLERQHEVGAPLGGSKRVDLVDDDGLDVPQRVSGARREHQVEGLGGGDQQVGGVTDELLALAGCRVAGAHPDDRLGERQAETLRRKLDALQRCPEVLLDVEGQGPQRRQVEEAGAVLAIGRLGGDEPVDAPEERGERLARAGGRQDQRVGARGDGRPALDLGRRRLGEGGREPLPHGW